MAFRRTLMKLAHEKHDVNPSLVKWWKKYYPVEGQITQSLSPHEQNIVGSLFANAPQKIGSYLWQWTKEIGPALGLGVFLYTWGIAKHEEIARSHRS